MPKFKYANNLRRNRGGPYKTEPVTELRRWRLRNVGGRQTWHYLESNEECEAWPQTLLDKHSLGLSTDDLAPSLPPATSAKASSYNALKFYAALQAEDGHWAGDYGGPYFSCLGLL
ncbi:LSS [Bugula neritina]|uniref:LSS n=1 Tax=Bugula neritina TaxID=10212 RepID=A0A7J7KMN9_BUGNE|nr:LSS [Bugula neritina]